MSSGMLLNISINDQVDKVYLPKGSLGEILSLQKLYLSGTVSRSGTLHCRKFSSQISCSRSFNLWNVLFSKFSSQELTFSKVFLLRKFIFPKVSSSKIYLLELYLLELLYPRILSSEPLFVRIPISSKDIFPSFRYV